MARTKTPVSEYKGLMVRLPEPMLNDCRAVASQERRSLNAQLLCMIEDWLNEHRAPQERHDDPHPPLVAGAVP